MTVDEMDARDIAIVEALCVQSLEAGYMRLNRYVNDEDRSLRTCCLQVKIFGVWMTLISIQEIVLPQNFSP
jgi:hypothetical protein